MTSTIDPKQTNLTLPVDISKSDTPDVYPETSMWSSVEFTCTDVSLSKLSKLLTILGPVGVVQWVTARHTAYNMGVDENKRPDANGAHPGMTDSLSGNIL